MQGLAALRMLLVTAMGKESPDALQDAAEEAVAQLDGEIGDLRELIAEMRGERRPGRFAPQRSIRPRSSA